MSPLLLLFGALAGTVWAWAAARPVAWDGWWVSLDRAGWVPESRWLTAGFLAVHGSAGAGLAGTAEWTASGGRTAIWVVAAAAALAEAQWIRKLFVRHNLRSSFTWVCMAWVFVALALAGVLTLGDATGWLVAPWLAALTYAAASSFVLWQVNDPSHH